VALRVAFDRRFRLLLVAAGGLALVSVSDALIYLGLQRQSGFDPAVFPLLFVGTALVFMALAIPVGRLADRVGRIPVLLGGHALLLPVYGLLLSRVGTAALLLSWSRSAPTSRPPTASPRRWRARFSPTGTKRQGFGMLITVMSIGELCSSLAFGALWFTLGLQNALIVFTLALAVMPALATPMLLRTQPEPFN
jgi:hypothetical protein